MRMWLRCGLLALCIAAWMATTTLADGTYSLKVSEINGVPISLGKACCDGAPGAVCTPDVVGAACDINSDCTDPRQPRCADVVCAFGNTAHCPIGNSTCQIFAGGNFCTLPTVLNAGEVAPGDIIGVDAFIKGWDALPNTGVCLASDAVGTCTIEPPTCDFKTVCDNNSSFSSGSNCDATRLCTSGFCQGAPDILCMDDAECTNIDCRGGLCILNECQTTPLALAYQWSFDVPSLSSGSAGAFVVNSASIDKNRSDYLFFGQSSWNIATVINQSGLLEYSSLLDDTNTNAAPVLDIGEEKYIGTMMLTPSAGAAGEFTLDYSPTPGVNFFNDETGAFNTVTDLRPLMINMTTDCNTTPMPQSWTSIGQHGGGCTFNPACGGTEYGQDISAGGGFSESRSTGINKIVVVYDIDVDVSNASVTVDGCDAEGFTQDTSAITMTVVAGANANEAVMMFSPSLPGNNPLIFEIPVVYDITISGVECTGPGTGAGAAIVPETRTAWAIFGDANATPIAVNNSDLGFVRSIRDIILLRPPCCQVIDPNNPQTGKFEIRADINNDNLVNNSDLGLVRFARDSITQPSGQCP